MDEIKKSCTNCGAELDDENGPCPQCSKDISDLGEVRPNYENDKEPSETFKVHDPLIGTKRGIIAGITAGTLVIGLAIGYLINALGGTGTVKSLSGPWTGTMAFTKITSSDKTFEKANQSGLNQNEDIEIDVYMHSNRAGGANIRGLNETGATSPLTYSNGKMKFSIKSGDITATFDCAISKDKATGNNIMKGTIKYAGKVDNGSGKKVDLTATGDLNLMLKKT